MYYNNLILVFTISFISSVLLGKVFISFLKKMKIKQNVLSYVSEHSSKNGTPTMGGLFFIIIGLIISLIFIKNEKRLAVFTLVITFAYMIVGFLDDYIKIKNNRNLGLKAYQKIIFQFSIAVICGIFCYRNQLCLLYVPFANKTINVGKWIIILTIVVFIATTNTVNLTDGLDGLAGTTCLIYLLGVILLLILQVNYFSSYYIIINEYKNLIKICVVFCGTISAFLIYNTYKASVFMGDTGSLGLGGLLASVSIVSGNMLYIPIMGFVFVTSGLSVIIQVTYFKITKGKRVFLMAPIHHHFQHKGLSESKIVFIYSMVTLFGVLLSLVSFL